MGSIPLPALSIKPPQQDDLLSKVGQITQLKSMMQAQQLQQGQLAMQPAALQAEQMKNQATAQDLQDNQIFTKAHQEAGGDWDKTISLATKYGASEKAIQTRQSGMADFQKKLTDKTKDDLANLKSQSEMIAQQAGAALQAPAEQRPALVKQGLSQMVQAGVLKPEDAQAQYAQYQQQGDDFLKSHMAGAITAQQQIANAAKKQDQALAQHAQQFKEGGISAEQAQTAAQRAQQLRLESQRVFLESKRVGMEGDRLQQQKGDKGTWSLQEDPAGKPVLFNNKTGEVQAAPAQIAKPGTYQKQIGGAEESVQYAKDYLSSKNFTGPGDEALMEKFFDVAKPSTGFRMTQPQMDMLNHATDIKQSLLARGKHLLSPNAPYFDDTQREHIVNTMNDIIAAKRKVHGGAALSQDSAPVTATGPNGHKIMLKNNQWVDAQTGAALQ